MKAKKKRVEDLSRQQRWQVLKRQEGLCPRCGDSLLDINPKTKRYYKLCSLCRKKSNAYQAKLMADRRAAGLA